MTSWLPATETAARFIVAIILNSLWEDAILVFAVFVLLRSLRNINASTRYFTWLVTMVAAVVLPILTSLPQTTMQSSHATQPAVTQSTAAGTASHAAPPRSYARHTATVPAKPSAEAVAPRFRTPERLHVQLPAWFATLLFIAWALVALVIGVRLGIDLFSLERLKRDSLPLPVEFRDQMERWVKAAYGNARDVRICVSEHIEVPVAVGLFDSMILLPKHLLEQLSAGELDRISLHELAHLHRADDWTNSVQRVAQILMFFNPAVRYVGSQLDLEREVACDDWVLALTGEVRPYATCLTRMAELTAWPHRALAAPGVFVTRKGISIRIERLLNKHRNARVKVAYGVPGIVAGALVAFFVLVNLVTPVIAYTTESASTTVAAVSRKIVMVTHLPHKQAAPPAAPVIQVIPAPAPTPQIVTKIVHERTLVMPEGTVHVRVPHALVRVPHIHVAPMPHIPYRNGVASDMNVNVPEVNVNVPEVNVHVPEVHVHVPAVNVHIPARVMRIPGSALRGPTIAANGPGGFSCTGCDFAGVNWAGKDMSGRSFVGADFSRANLEGANFSHANLSGVDFSHANLRNANFNGASMNGCDMSKADVTGAHFEGAHISGCDGIDARALDQTQLRVWLTQCNGCNFQNADFHGMDLRNIHSSGMDFERANFAGADLSGARFSGANFSHANLAGAKLHGTQFSGCDFDHTDLRNVDLSDASMTGSNLSDAIMR